ncbi:hypothetical protein N0V82_009339 [Gnomoniopsis sp. IMI 355080]|nr:hypothetical protein N0V82_009339 [Gnomoniopsis sp. IMI 355080]
MVKDSGGFVKSKAKGTVNFPPFESLDEHCLREIRRYQIYPWGKIQEYCRHIPYNSGKKDFYDKTGRESFEVFQYIFKVPGDETEYTVMWDYNIGLVRMTPFFKCCKYSKVCSSRSLRHSRFVVANVQGTKKKQTQPAKMLNLNPGLRDITHSITGGSIAAQGYWMPFACAKAVCATFCAPIAGALIPIFGPDFPSQCINPDAPEHGRMQIDQMIVAESAREAEMFRRMYANAASVAANSHLPSHHQHQLHYSKTHPHNHGPALPSPTSISSPHLGRRAVPRHSGSPFDYDRERLGLEGRLRFKHGPESPYTTSSEPDIHTRPELHHHALSTHTVVRGGTMYSPLSPPRSSGNGGEWTVRTHALPSHPQYTHTHSGRPGGYLHPGAYQEIRELSHPTASDPILSAIPRLGRGNQRLEYQTYQHSQHHLHPPPQPQPYFPPRLPPVSASSVWDAPHNIPSSKRPATDIMHVPGDYDEYSDKSSPTTTVTTGTSISREDCGPEPAATSGTDKNAALLLMNLSVRDHPKDVRSGFREEAQQQQQREVRHRVPGARGCGPESMSMSPVSGPDGQDGHRNKRRRATSM